MWRLISAEVKWCLSEPQWDFIKQQKKKKNKKNWCRQAGARNDQELDLSVKNARQKGNKKGNKGDGTQVIFNQNKTMEKAAKYSGINGKNRKYAEDLQVSVLFLYWKESGMKS